MLPLRFGDLNGKKAAEDFLRRQEQRNKLVENVIIFHTRWVHIDEWPTINTPLCAYPKALRRLPLSILQEAAEALRVIKENALNCKSASDPA